MRGAAWALRPPPPSLPHNPPARCARGDRRLVRPDRPGRDALHLLLLQLPPQGYAAGRDHVQPGRGPAPPYEHPPCAAPQPPPTPSAPPPGQASASGCTCRSSPTASAPATRSSPRRDVAETHPRSPSAAPPSSLCSTHAILPSRPCPVSTGSFRPHRCVPPRCRRPKPRPTHPRQVDYAYTTIPTYPSGQIGSRPLAPTPPPLPDAAPSLPALSAVRPLAADSPSLAPATGFLLCSTAAGAVLRRPLREPTPEMQAQLKYYSPAAHAAVALAPRGSHARRRPDRRRGCL